MRTLESIKDLRDGIVDAIKNANIDGIGSNVYSARKEFAWPEECAFAVVYTPHTSFDDKRTSPRFYMARTEIYVDVYARSIIQNEDGEIIDVNDFLDVTSSEIVKCLQCAEDKKGPFEGTVRRFVLTNFSNNLSESGETDRGSQRLTFSAEYAVCVNNSNATDEFLRAKNSLNMGLGSGNKQEFTTNMRAK